MNKIEIIKNKSYIKLCLIVAFLLIVSSESYWFGTSGIIMLERLKNIALILFPFIMILLNYRQKYLYNNLSLLFIIELIVILSSVINGNSFGAPLLIFSGMIFGLFLSTKYTVVEFFSSFSDIVLLLSIYSFLIWFCVSLHILPSNVISNIADAHMTTSLGCIFFPILLDSIIRNSSIFREPGVFMILLNTSLIFELFILSNKYRKVRIAVLIAALISTFSTAGIIILSFIFLIFFFQRKVNIYTWGIVFIIIVIILSSSIIAEDYIDEMFGKFETIEEYGSGFARYSSFLIPLNIFIHNPLWGCGFTEFPIEYEKFGYELFNRYVDSQGMSTNTFMNIFAIFGCFFGLFMVYGLYKFCKLLSSGNKVYTFSFYIIFFMMFSNESMPYFPFLYIFFFYGFNKKLSLTKINSEL